MIDKAKEAELEGFFREIAERQGEREGAFVDVPEALWVEDRKMGPPVVKLTPYLHLVLVGLGNPFVCGGGVCGFSAIREFLFVVSPGYRIDSNWRRWAWRWRYRRLDFTRAHRGIREYLRRSFADAPSSPAERSSGRGTPQDNGRPWRVLENHLMAASCVAVFAREFGWSEERILHTPFARLFQYLQVMNDADRKDRPRFSPADRFKREWLRMRNGLPRRDEEGEN